MVMDAPIAFVSGSGRRLGRRIALALAARGYDLILHAHTSIAGADEAAAQIEAGGRRAWRTHGDLRSMDDIRRLSSEIGAITTRLDLLVHNAGLFPGGAFEDITPGQWDDAQSVNTRAVFFLTQGCAPLLRAARGSVVTIASAGAYAPWAAHIPYTVSKAAQLMLVRALAKALAPDVRVNAVAPGVVTLPGEQEAAPLPPARIPLGTHATADDIISAIVYLATATQVTGAVIPVDGGMSTAR
jgi:pteridine reductase